jgi:tRNA pseudouridine32 synthase / 23S rRNA pseudouridine746 synthase
MFDDPHFLALESEIKAPAKFNFPFYYDPHPLAVKAAEKLMCFLENEAEGYGWEFGFKDGESGQSRGRMFGILVVEAKNGKIGFVAAYSGNTPIPDKGYPFVPPVFDFWDKNDFYLKGIKEYERLTQQIDQLENAKDFIELKSKYFIVEIEAAKEISELQELIKSSKKTRDEIRAKGSLELSPEEFELLNLKMVKESTDLNYSFKRLKKSWRERLEQLKTEINVIETTIENIFQERKLLSNSLQERIFKGFQFLNRYGATKGLDEIFANTALKFPPSGAGECAAPRLLQYAFKMGYKPITMAEFWWGVSSKDEIRGHKNYYPACRGKCFPILSHMLLGLEVEENPLLSNPDKNVNIEIVYEDSFLLVINKPHGLLSVPGKEIQDSVFSRIQLKYPDATGPLIVHRLDMDTSGLMLIAKNSEIYKKLQSQFIRRKVKKRYVALLEGVVRIDTGSIELPLIGDYINRPRQMVSFETGKKALTHFEVIWRKAGRTLINFYPHTGRTHQLRVHAAHKLGLNCPIVGDDLYGIKDKRLYLHAEALEFEHPVTKEIIKLEQLSGF